MLNFIELLILPWINTSGTRKNREQVQVNLPGIESDDFLTLQERGSISNN